MILHSPTERGEVIRALTRLAGEHGIGVASSGIPEPLGVDFAWMPDHADGWHGIQRKELHDFLASVDDGRLTKEVAQMRAGIIHPFLVMEGRIQVTSSGQVLTKGYGRDVDLSRLQKQWMTLASQGIPVLFAQNATDTARLIMVTYWWSQSPDHGTAMNRPKPASDWGRLTNRDFQIHMLMGLDGIGRKTAADIVDTLGRCPIRVDATVEELMSVPGIGERTARKIIHSINGDVDAPPITKGKPMKRTKAKRVGVNRGRANGSQH